MENLLLISIALAPPLLIGLYLYFRDRYVKEPLKWLLISYGIGWLIVAPILLLHSAMGWAGISEWLNGVFVPGSIWGSILDAFILASFIEEGFKYLAFKKWIWNNRFFDEYYDGILYAALISLGFASLENILYVFDYGFETGVSRALTAIPAHTFFGITMGFFFSRAKFNFTNTRRNLWLALLVPVLLHGLYDFILFEIARFDDADEPYFIVVALSFWILMIFMLVYSRKRIRKMLKRDKASYEL
jgi:RsiW-degrading membrane proteinase PrsW (M82 family)